MKMLYVVLCAFTFSVCAMDQADTKKVYEDPFAACVRISKAVLMTSYGASKIPKEDLPAYWEKRSKNLAIWSAAEESAFKTLPVDIAPNAATKRDTLHMLGRYRTQLLCEAGHENISIGVTGYTRRPVDWSCLIKSF